MRKFILTLSTVVLAGFGLSACEPGGSDYPASPSGGAEVCGTIAGLVCINAADYCHFDIGVCSSIADAQGECRPKPEACTREFIPVCGCDGKTYGNACGAYAAGTSIDHTGECPTQN